MAQVRTVWRAWALPGRITDICQKVTILVSLLFDDDLSAQRAYISQQGPNRRCGTFSTNCTCLYLWTSVSQSGNRKPSRFYWPQQNFFRPKFFCQVIRNISLLETQISSYLLTVFKISVCFWYMVCGKATLITGLCGPEGSGRLRLQITRHSVHEGGKVVTFTDRPPLPPGISWYSFLETESTPGHTEMSAATE